MSIGVNLFDEAERAGVIKSMDQSKSIAQRLVQ